MSARSYTSAINRAAEMCKDYDRGDFVARWRAGSDERTAREALERGAAERIVRMEKLAAEREMLKRLVDRETELSAAKSVRDFPKYDAAVVTGSGKLPTVAELETAVKALEKLGAATKKASTATSEFGRALAATAPAPKPRTACQHDSLRLIYERHGDCLGRELKLKRFNRVYEDDYGKKISSVGEAVYNTGMVRHPREHLIEALHGCEFGKAEHPWHADWVAHIESCVNHWSEDDHKALAVWLEMRGAREGAREDVERREKLATIAAEKSRKRAVERERALAEERDEVLRLKEQLHREEQERRLEAMRREAEEAELAAITLQAQRDAVGGGAW